MFGIFIYKNKSAQTVEAQKENTQNTSNTTNTTVEDTEEADLEEVVYAIENKDFNYENEEDEDEKAEVNLFEYNNTNSDYAEIYYRLNSYNTEEGYTYTIEARNEEGKSLLLNERQNSVSERDVIGGVVSYIKIDKELLNSKIEITIKEMYEHSERSRTLERKAQTTLNLSTDLEQQEKIDFTTSTAKYEIEDLEFEVYKDEKVEKSTYSTASINCKGTTYSIGLSAQYGNTVVSEEHIDFYAVNNINNLNLRDAFDIESQIAEKVGQYGLSDKYKIFVTNGTGEIRSEFEITFDDMKNLIDGKEINADGKRIYAQDILEEDSKLEVGESSDVTIANGIKAKKYNYKTETERTNYMFIVGDYIYYLNVPNSEKYEDSVEMFLDSIKQK